MKNTLCNAVETCGKNSLGNYKSIVTLKLKGSNPIL
jgi:hypothetical protein